MSYQNFIPTVWAAGIEKQLAQLNVFVEDCHGEYEGTVKNMGESVKITGIGRPTVHKLTIESKNKNIPDVETLEDYSILMPIDQMLVINYKVDDIDEAQAKENVMKALEGETSEALNDEIDSYIAGLAKEKTVSEVLSYTGSSKLTEENVLESLDKAYKRLIKNNVKTSTKIIATVDPDFYILFKNKYLKLSTDNVEEFKNGKVGTYNTMTIKMSNNVAKDADGNSYIMVRTRKAVAYARPFTHLEAYRPEKGFSDAIKGYTLFGAKIIRPKEIAVIKAAY